MTAIARQLIEMREFDQWRPLRPSQVVTRTRETGASVNEVSRCAIVTGASRGEVGRIAIETSAAERGLTGDEWLAQFGPQPKCGAEVVGDAVAELIGKPSGVWHVGGARLAARDVTAPPPRT